MVAGRVASVLTLLGGGSVLLNRPDLPVVRVNDEDVLLSHWPSEDFAAAIGAPPECRFWAFNESYDASLCSHFTIGRSSGAVGKAAARALACAGAHATECVLSPEIGLALPAAFLYSNITNTMRMVLGPKVLPLDEPAPTQHVRVATPGGDALVNTQTFLFNTSIRVEYLDGATRAMVTTDLFGDAAYCVQLLRLAFEPMCWQKIE